MASTRLLHQTHNALDVDARAELVNLLNQVLANLQDLVMQTLEAHWNVRGSDFYTRHKLFEELADLLEAHVDTTAERITALGGFAHGSARKVASRTQLRDLPVDPEGVDYITLLSEHYGTFANGVRAAVKKADELGDDGTTDLLTGLSRDADKALWFLEAHQLR